ncbi:nickel pincer cofactor biosynthesis protein LarC [Anaerosacchariphilus polymeriproducens]|uniref:Pyridinium-3,5-bisthiocarboxylic acid mononucleotide nickel insertion protein n=2 Tax=Anaerosacchariphilus polymeriproducens TaxID=1812858 RepID=A0A371AX46_9FIRM|nr:nickel pincer cofactor biosynthesis protein LarC [Anaerosacchariphilus polymeriproducens]
MTVGAFLDLGVEKDYLQKVLEELPLSGYEIEIKKETKKSIEGTAFRVILKEEPVSHRNLTDIYHIIDEANLSDRVKQSAKGIFEIVAKAEAKAHGISIEKVHFHEVGAIDSIIDIIAAAVCVERLGIEHVAVSVLYEGQGYTECQHGKIPVPVPAVVNIIQEYNLPIQITNCQGEMVTPTGAAIAAYLKNLEQHSYEGKIERVGIGIGCKEFEHANILRAMIIEENKNSEGDLWILESNIDDSTGETLSYTMEKLFQAGARDVYYIPIFMKKNRPAYLLNVICQMSEIETMEGIIFYQTTTIGIRKFPIKRRILDRKMLTVNTQFGITKAKICYFEEQTFCYPEYESVRNICEAHNIDFQSAYAMIQDNAIQQLEDNIR